MANFTTVKLYIYDLSGGLATALSTAILGKQVNGVWHTGVCVYGREYLYGSDGVSYTAPEEIYRLGLTVKPKGVVLGETKKTLTEIQSWIQKKSSTSFRGHQYDLLDWNCNNFSDEFTKYLLEKETTVIPEEILELPRIVKTTPLGQMLRSFLTNDPISAAQRAGNNNSASSSIHKIIEDTKESDKFDKIPVQHSILPSIDKNKIKINSIEQFCNRTLTTDEKTLLFDIQLLFQPDASCSPLLTREHLMFLISLMVNSIQDQSGQLLILQILQLISEYEYVINILSEVKGQESPTELLKGLNEQPEQIQIEFLRWFSCIAATSNGRKLLTDIQDDIVPLFTECIQNDTVSSKAKYEIAVVLHNLLCINIDIRLSFMNSVSLGSAIVQYISTPIDGNQAEVFLTVLIALSDAEKDIYAIAKAMDFNPNIYSTINNCQPLIEKLQMKFQNI